jgi:predicted DCC family thiol-disulfide oxidoreductase YuxK
MNFADLPRNKKYILFDGVCNLCNNAVQFVIKKDGKDIFRFISLQSELGQNILYHLELNPQAMNSIVLFIPESLYYTKAKAIIRIGEELGGIFTFAKLLRCIPSFISNFIYGYIARNRYRWYGKKSSCMIASKQINNKFLG